MPKQVCVGQTNRAEIIGQKCAVIRIDRKVLSLKNNII